MASHAAQHAAIDVIAPTNFFVSRLTAGDLGPHRADYLPSWSGIREQRHPFIITSTWTANSLMLEFQTPVRCCPSELKCV